MVVFLDGVAVRPPTLELQDVRIHDLRHSCPVTPQHGVKEKGRGKSGRDETIEMPILTTTE